jgi:hypothetical protein
MSIKDEFEKQSAEEDRQVKLAAENNAQAEKAAKERATRLFDSIKGDQDFLAKHGFIAHLKGSEVELKGGEESIVCVCSASGISVELWHDRCGERESLSAEHDYDVASVPEAEARIAKILKRDKSELSFSIRKK